MTPLAWFWGLMIGGFVLAWIVGMPLRILQPPWPNSRPSLTVSTILTLGLALIALVLFELCGAFAFVGLITAHAPHLSQSTVTAFSVHFLIITGAGAAAIGIIELLTRLGTVIYRRRVGTGREATA